MAQECNSVVCGVYDVCGARVASWSGLVNFGCSECSEIWAIRIAFTKCKFPDIPYTPVSEWFRMNLGLVDDPGTPIPKGREPKKSRSHRQEANDVEMAIEAEFKHMDDDMEAVHGQENAVNVEVNNLINEVVNEVVNLGEHGVDTMESIMGLIT